MAVELATGASGDGPATHPRAHVGYYLIDAGLPQFEATFAYRPRLGERFAALVPGAPNACISWYPDGAHFLNNRTPVALDVSGRRETGRLSLRHSYWR